MRRYLLDSGIAGDYINRRHGIRARVHEEIAKGNHVGIGVPVLAELYYGIEYSTTRERNLKRLYQAMSTLRLWPLTGNAAALYGRIAADLRRVGRPMQIF